jgi:hypothetical protein
MRAVGEKNPSAKPRRAGKTLAACIPRNGVAQSRGDRGIRKVLGLKERMLRGGTEGETEYERDLGWLTWLLVGAGETSLSGTGSRWRAIRCPGLRGGHGS